MLRSVGENAQREEIKSWSRIGNCGIGKNQILPDKEKKNLAICNNKEIRWEGRKGEKREDSVKRGKNRKGRRKKG